MLQCSRISACVWVCKKTTNQLCFTIRMSKMCRGNLCPYNGTTGTKLCFSGTKITKKKTNFLPNLFDACTRRFSRRISEIQRVCVHKEFVHAWLCNRLLCWDFEYLCERYFFFNLLKFNLYSFFVLCSAIIISL